MQRLPLWTYRLSAASAALATAVMPALAWAAPKADEHAEEAGSENPLQFFPPAFVWNLIVFLVLLAVLWKFVWPNILAGLNARDEKLRGDLKAAEQANDEAQKTLSEYKAQLADAQKEYQRVVEEAKQAAAQVEAQKVAEMEARLADMEARSKAGIQAAQQQALAEIYETTATLATDVAGRILQREVNPSDHDALVQDALSQINASSN